MTSSMSGSAQNAEDRAVREDSDGGGGGGGVVAWTAAVNGLMC